MKQQSPDPVTRVLDCAVHTLTTCSAKQATEIGFGRRKLGAGCTKASWLHQRFAK